MIIRKIFNKFFFQKVFALKKFFLKTGAITVNFYTDADLMIGRIVNIFGRKMLLTDCDEFTRQFYQKKYGINNFEPVRYDSGINAVRVERMNPPFNGFGSEEDSMASCQKMVPEPPKKDFIKWMRYDRYLSKYIKKSKKRLSFEIL